MNPAFTPLGYELLLSRQARLLNVDRCQAAAYAVIQKGWCRT